MLQFKGIENLKSHESVCSENKSLCGNHVSKSALYKQLVKLIQCISQPQTKRCKLSNAITACRYK